MQRVSKNDFYLSVALEHARRGTCLKWNFGAVIVNNDEIVATGYNGSPRGALNCCDMGYCTKDKGCNCRSVHAEQNAIISASRNDMVGATMYIAGIDKEGNELFDVEPCGLCGRMLLNAGIAKVCTRKEDGKVMTTDVITYLLLEKCD